MYNRVILLGQETMPEQEENNDNNWCFEQFSMFGGFEGTLKILRIFLCIFSFNP